MEKKRELFEKQRRNLIIISITIFLINYLGLDFNQISILGNQATITNTANITNLLWVLMAYWFVRYSQYYYINETTFMQDLSFRRDGLLTEIVKELYPFDSSPLHEYQNTSTTVFRSDICSAKVRLYHEYIELSTGNTTNEEINHSFSLKDVRFSLITFGAIMSIFIKTPYFTEYLLPYLLCFGVILTSQQ